MEKVWIAIEVKAETDLALLANSGMEKDAWVPKSQILDYSDDYRVGDCIEIELPEWLALDKGMI